MLVLLRFSIAGINTLAKCNLGRKGLFGLPVTVHLLEHPRQELKQGQLLTSLIFWLSSLYRPGPPVQACRSPQWVRSPTN